MQMYSEPLNDDIFVDFIHSVYVETDRDSLKGEALELTDSRETVYNSNRGYQSTSYHRGTPNASEDGLESIERVVESCYEYASVFLEKKFSASIHKMSWWLNVNRNGEFNVPHNHGRCDLMGLYYISAPPQSGRLVLERNDGSSYSSLYDNEPGGRHIEIDPVEGRLYLIPGHLWHWVENNLSSDPRISIAINIYLHEWVYAYLLRMRLRGIERLSQEYWQPLSLTE